MGEIIKICLVVPVIVLFTYTSWKYSLQRNRRKKTGDN